MSGSHCPRRGPLPLLWLAPVLLLACKSKLEVVVERYQGELILSKEGRQQRLESVVLATQAAVDSRVYEAVKVLWSLRADSTKRQTLQTGLRLLAMVAWKNPLDPSKTVADRDKLLQLCIEGMGPPATLTIEELAKAASLDPAEARQLSGVSLDPIPDDKARELTIWYFDYISRSRVWLEPPTEFAEPYVLERSIAFAERLQAIARALETLEEPLRKLLKEEHERPGQSSMPSSKDEKALEILVRTWATLVESYPRIAGLANFGMSSTADPRASERNLLVSARKKLLEKLDTSIPGHLGDPSLTAAEVSGYLDSLEFSLMRLGELQNPYVPVPSAGEYLALEEMYAAARKSPRVAAPIGESWKKVGNVKVQAGANANYVVMRDHIGNWQVRAARNDPTELINAAYSGALAVIDLATQTGQATQNLRDAYKDFAAKQKAGLASPLAMDGLVDLLQERYDADLAALEEKLRAARATLEEKRALDPATEPTRDQQIAEATQNLRALLEEKVELQASLANDLDLIEEALRGAKPADTSGTPPPG